MLWKVSPSDHSTHKYNSEFRKLTLSLLSPCRWGFCGLTEEFCTANKTAPPGTACQSNCQLPSEFDNVGKSTGTYRPASYRSPSAFRCLKFVGDCAFFSPSQPRTKRHWVLQQL